MILFKYLLVLTFLLPGFYAMSQDKSTGKKGEEKVKKILWEDGVENAYPRWSNDGTKILYQSNRTGNWQIYVMVFHALIDQRPKPDFVLSSSTRLRPEPSVSAEATELLE